MTEVNPLLNTTAAGKLAQQLDAADGETDGKISESIWNEFVKDKGGKTVDEFISTEDAMNSITTYVIKEAKNKNKNATELAQEWTNAAPASNNSSEGSNGAAKTAASKKKKQTGKTVTKPTEGPASRKSTITVSDNGLNMGSGMPVDKDGNELKDANGKRNFKDPKFKEGGSIMKYTHGDKTMFQQTNREKSGSLYSLVKFSAPTIEELKKMISDFDAAAARVKSAPENESEEDKKKRVAANIAAFKELITISQGNIQVIRNVAEKLRDDNYVDRKSDDYKALVQDLLLTKDAQVVETMLPITGEGNNSNMLEDVIENDKTAHEILAGTYQEIRNKEKAGEKLTDDEIALKEAVAERKIYGGYMVEADAEKGIHEKYMAYNNMDGTPTYQVCIDNNCYYAKDPNLLDEFLTELEKADNDEKKAALFKKYINTEDTELAKCLAQNVKTLNAADEDIISLINSNGMEVLDILPFDDTTYSKAVNDAVVARMKEIFTTDKGNLENAYYLNNLNWIDRTELSDEDKNKLKTEILETYFEVSKDDEGNKTYTFKPSRRPTYEEMDKLSNNTNSKMDEAIAKYITPEDMGKGQYTEAVEGVAASQAQSRYADLVDGMEDKKDVLKLIDDVVYKNSAVPFDKILEKYSDDAEIKRKLLDIVDSSSTISDTNRLALAKTCIKDEGNGKVSFDKTKLPNGMDAYNYADKVLPANCNEGDAKKYFDAAIKELGKEDLGHLQDLREKNSASVRARIGELVKANQNDNEFIQKVMACDSSIIPFDVISTIDAAKAKWNDKTKKAVFTKTFDDRIYVKDRAKHLETAVKNHLVTKVAEDKYAIGDTVYKTSWYNNGADGKAGTKDDTVALKAISKTGYEHGIAMYKELKGLGSGDIKAMLNGETKGENDYKNYVTKDNVVGILEGFKQMSPEEGLMEYIANEWNSVLTKNLSNVIPKALMDKAKDLGLQNTKAYKELQKFFGVDKNGKFTKNDESSYKRYTSDTAAELDKMLYALMQEILKKQTL